MSVKVWLERVNLRERTSLSVDGAIPSAGGLGATEQKEKGRRLVACWSFYLSSFGSVVT